MSSEEIRVFHGLSEVAGQGHYSVKGLRKLGIPVEYLLWRPNPAKYSEDAESVKSLNIDMSRKYMLPIWSAQVLYYECRMLCTKDVFHFHFGRSILLNHDLGLLQLLHKKVFFEFHGSDLRDGQLAQQINPYMVYTQSEKMRRKFRKRAKKICAKANGIILHDDELIPHLPADHPDIYEIPLRVDIDRIEPAYAKADKKCIRIVHAPSNREIKGTKWILEAIDHLKERYEIEFILVEGKTQEEAFAIYRTADIIVDQIKMGTYGVLAIEGMAMGKPVITYVMESMKESFPEELPVYSANVDTIEKALEELITDGELRERLGRAGRTYVEKYHDYKKNAKMLWEVYTGKIPPMHGREAFKHASEIILKD